MKILAITARFPPLHFGGYELRNKEILDEMNKRGHQVYVITSNEKKKELQSKESNYSILRTLHIRKKAKHFFDEILFDWQDIAFIDNNIKKIKPNVVYLGHIQPLTNAILPYLSSKKIPLLYDEGGGWLVQAWKQRFNLRYESKFSFINKIMPITIKALNMISSGNISTTWKWPENMDVIFNSQLNYKNAFAAGVPIEKAHIIHSGIDLEQFSFRLKGKSTNTLVVLVPGRIEPGKGQLDALKLVASLIELGINARLVLVGEVWDKSYFQRILKEIETLNIKDKIEVFPMVTHEKMAEFYYDADICFFSSYYKTGFSRTPLEAMACGCLVFSYGNEGSKEVINQGKNGFLFSAGDYLMMVDVIINMQLNPIQAIEIMKNARREMEENYSLNIYIDKIEEMILAISGNSYP
jgi:glycosyltransferase involved in cell wall biosynthesis